MRKSDIPRLLSADREDCYKLWYIILNDYSKRKLTFAKDKIRAIDGLVADLDRVVGDRLVQGIWMTNCARSLLWVLLRNIIPTTVVQLTYPPTYKDLVEKGLHRIGDVARFVIWVLFEIITWISIMWGIQESASSTQWRRQSSSTQSDADFEEDTNFEEGIELHLRTECSFPSWSWASFDGPLSNLCLISKPSLTFSKAIEYAGAATIYSHKAQDGQLQIKGLCRHAKVDSKKDWRRAKELAGRELIFWGKKTLRGLAYMDDDKVGLHLKLLAISVLTDARFRNTKKDATYFASSWENGASKFPELTNLLRSKFAVWFWRKRSILQLTVRLKPPCTLELASFVY